MRRLLIVSLALVIVPVGELPAEDSEAVIRQAIESYVEAFNRHDAVALANHWADDGELISPDGTQVQGKQKLATVFAEYFQEAQDVRLELTGTSIEFLSPHVAVERGVARVIAPDEEPSDTEYQAVHVKSPAGWKLDRVSEQAAPSPPPSHYAQLKELEWMIGQWQDDDEEISIVTNCRWTTNQNFIVRSFQVVAGERVDFEGTQVVGWDPNAQAIRSWLFDSDGSFGVGRWSKGDGRWSVQTLQVLADGRRASATNVYQLLDENTVQFQSIGRSIDGELLPNIGPVTVVRTSP